MGTTTFRPPYTPISLGALTGRNVGAHFRCLRRTPMHDWNLANGAAMMDAGLWQRPWYFARQGETINEAYVRETETVRKAVGLCDVTSLGKIAVQGPDATEFLNRVYTNPFAKLAIGKARYGIMLRDDGIVMDDGTTWRLSETEYFMTTTTAHAANLVRETDRAHDPGMIKGDGGKVQHRKTCPQSELIHAGVALVDRGDPVHVLPGRALEPVHAIAGPTGHHEATGKVFAAAGEQSVVDGGTVEEVGESLVLGRVDHLVVNEMLAYRGGKRLAGRAFDPN